MPFDLFKKREQGQPVPVDQILQMKQQGMSSTQITEALQRQGFGVQQIFDAMSQADVKAGVENMPIQQQMPIDNPMQYPQQPFPYPQQQEQHPADSGSREKIEEIAEAIIDEKWNDLIKDVNKIIEWKERTDQRIAQIEANFASMKSDFDKLHTAILEKVGDYDKHISDVGTELKALEMVFQKVLPTFTENINELSRITKDMKAAKSIPKLDNRI